MNIDIVLVKSFESDTESDIDVDSYGNEEKENPQKLRKRVNLQSFLRENPWMGKKPNKDLYDEFSKALAAVFDIPDHLLGALENAINRDILWTPSTEEFEKCDSYIDWLRASPEEGSWCIVSFFYYLFKTVNPDGEPYFKKRAEIKAISDLLYYLAEKYRDDISSYIYRIEAVCDLDEYLFDDFEHHISERLNCCIHRIKTIDVSKHYLFDEFENYLNERLLILKNKFSKLNA